MARPSENRGETSNTRLPVRLGVDKRYDEAERRQRALEDLERLLARFEVVDVSRSIAVAAAEIVSTLGRRGEPLYDLHDVYIGATAMTEQLPVLTANVDRFERIDGLAVVDWTDF